MAKITSIRFLPADDEIPHDRVEVRVPDGQPDYERIVEVPVSDRSPGSVIDAASTAVRRAQELAEVRSKLDAR